jgi:hypothetical protein
LSYAQFSAPSYLIGEQKVSAVDSKECFLELKYSGDQKQVSLRAIVTNTHENHLIPVGELLADYIFVAGSVQKNAYYFQDKTPKAPVKQLLLVAEDPMAPSVLTAAVFHDGHHDPVSCENLSVATGDELSEAIDLFANFDDLEDEHAH